MPVKAGLGEGFRRRPAKEGGAAMTVNQVALEWVPVIMALVTLTKRYLPRAYAPLYAIGYGILLSLALQYPDIRADNGVNVLLQGIVLGLVASGLYEVPGVKKYEYLLRSSGNSDPPGGSTGPESPPRPSG
ncbi:hypothetical protein [Hydrogenibacillus schlegelii]|uniref:Holin n=2 Tax=Hydrogenibacillus schlegelii TaxID=1484 RepID=A0A132N742_HYDSH|nr:hypothetical protein [Hydrogenibacillus schlegelii]KWX05923.1 hypothetical protein TR75_07410 [Hydrogenibacillus schlegelii]OAR04885.1 hypothetical protein SA87_09795 [Hydrogenibacillus schlegelii]